MTNKDHIPTQAWYDSLRDTDNGQFVKIEQTI